MTMMSQVVTPYLRTVFPAPAVQRRLIINKPLRNVQGPDTHVFPSTKTVAMLMDPASMFYTFGVGESTVQPPDTQLFDPSLFQIQHDPLYRKDISGLFGIETWVRSWSVTMSILTVVRSPTYVSIVVSCDIIQLALYEKLYER